MEIFFTVIVSIVLLIAAIVEGTQILKSNFDRINLDSLQNNESELK